jgi:hypothetical protein
MQSLSRNWRRCLWFVAQVVGYRGADGVSNLGQVVFLIPAILILMMLGQLDLETHLPTGALREHGPIG